MQTFHLIFSLQASAAFKRVVVGKWLTTFFLFFFLNLICFLAGQSRQLSWRSMTFISVYTTNCRERSTPRLWTETKREERKNRYSIFPGHLALSDAKKRTVVSLTETARTLLRCFRSCKKIWARFQGAVDVPWKYNVNDLWGFSIRLKLDGKKECYPP